MKELYTPQGANIQWQKTKLQAFLPYTLTLVSIGGFGKSKLLYLGAYIKFALFCSALNRMNVAVSTQPHKVLGHLALVPQI